jgi:hypothetical protein
VIGDVLDQCSVRLTLKSWPPSSRVAFKSSVPSNFH